MFKGMMDKALLWFYSVLLLVIFCGCETISPTESSDTVMRQVIVSVQEAPNNMWITDNYQVRCIMHTGLRDTFYVEDLTYLEAYWENSRGRDMHRDTIITADTKWEFK